MPQKRTIRDADILRLRINLVGMLVFVIVNIPSIKLFLGPRPIVNVVVLAVLLGFAGVRVLRRARLSVPRSGLVLLGGLISVVTLSVFAALFEDRVVSSDLQDALAGFIYVILTTGVVLTAANEQDRKAYLWLQAGWGFLLAILHQAGYIHASRDLKQHYNTVTLPIALSALAIIAPLLAPTQRRRLSLTKWLLIIGALVIELLAFLSLPGRSPFIGIPLIVLFVLIFSRLRRFSVPGFLGKSIQVLVISALLGYLVVKAIQIFDVSIHSYLLYRFEQLMTQGIANEPRIPFILRTVRHILDNPLGYGLGSYSQVIEGNYPHNLVLDALFTGGWLAGLILVLCLGLVFRRLFWACRDFQNSENVGIFMVASYLFFTFMNSYSLSGDSHLLFACLALGLAAQARVSGAK
jgi:hypothetical protein